MKYYNKLLFAVALPAMLASCADADLVEYTTEKPEKLAEYEYLNAYDALKTYIDRAAYPNFKLGGGVNGDEFLKGELVYALASSNYDEITFGNAMKYDACVKDDGSMDFSQVASLVEKAKGAGLTIYGHTLAWHSQQRPDYLNSLIAPTVIPGGGAGGNGGYCLVLHNEAEQGNVWDAQVFYTFDNVLSQGVTYTLTCKAKATEETAIEVYTQGDSQGYPGSFSVGTEWTSVSFPFTPGDGTTNKIALNFGKFVGKVYIDDVSVTAAGSSDNLVHNGDFEEGNINGWRSWSNNFENVSEDGEGYSAGGGGGIKLVELIADGDFEAGNEANYQKNGAATMEYTAAGQGSDGKGRAVKVTNPAIQENDYGAQFIFFFSPQAVEGETYEFSVDVRADVPTSFGTQAQTTPGAYLYWKMFGDINVTTEWQTFKATVTINADLIGLGAVSFNLGKTATSFYFDNLSFKKEVEETGGDIIIEQTPEEKADTLTWAMDKWIKGMMEACEGNVTTWDVVNEAISGGGNDGEGFYVLQSAKNVSEEDAQKNFYWQDYLGSEGYVRTVVGLARKYFAEYGGNPSDLKLFINDYNLESDWDNNKKVKSLIHWIEKWEADGVTKIDGIGTQMHVSCYANSDTQQKKEEHVVKMFELLAASGKLIKISELDMGYIDANGNEVKTVNMTEEQHKAMADYYKFIVQKYLEIIPAAQQYGITAWAITDSPDAENSYWRKGQPIGLWDLNYNRKHTYAGFADGLAGKK